ncbi:MAG: class I SAM-dependent methyltransferase [Elusimicrobia bacterium]|nr:class I SAM-dependent methyltransferase [Elusimicrobiota bacterium]
MDPEKRFSETADPYDSHRPSYPESLVDWVLKTSGVALGARVADVGCGTGISTRLFAARGLGAVGIDPNEEMLARARARGGADYRRGSASATGLPAHSVDLMVAAQAFHWFNLEPTLLEFKRVLKPGGWCAAFWNERTRDSAFLRAYEELLLRSSSEYRAMPHISDAMAAIRSSRAVVAWTQSEFPNVQSMDRAAFVGRVYSSSYVAHGISRRKEFDRAIRELFDRHAVGGRVEFKYRSLGACWRLR